ncbi:hypothetical protein [Microbacterium sp.]|uniref:hypothetical protein n=1 Tax=Microbacterium sp. TaxID=51671 RepID=UPI002B9ACDDE|nr:hypothetical protein [Microbacterium sp.]HWK77242.1 hypothetical protein [Microbacterium sp.]
MHVVIFSPTDSFSAEALPMLDPADRVTVVRWAGHESDEPGRIAVGQGTLSARVVAAARGNVLIRTVVRATPLDTGARFWRATRSDSRVRDAVRTADVIVAPERDGGYAAWAWRRLAARKGRELAVVAGYPAARNTIEQSR